VKRQVDGAEEIGEPFGPRSFIGHATRVPADRSIVNPDGSAESARFWLKHRAVPHECRSHAKAPGTA
jgi:hypothetical protein